MKNTIAQELAIRVMARANCIEHGNQNWTGRHEDSVESLIERLPSESGIHYGTSIDYEKSRTNRVVLSSAYNIMNDDGHYTGMVDYRVVVTPSLQFGFNVNIVGNFSSSKDGHGIKEYLIDLYDFALRENV